jgi:hypothetical protein
VHLQFWGDLWTSMLSCVFCSVHVNSIHIFVYTVCSWSVPNVANSDLQFRTLLIIPESERILSTTPQDTPSRKTSLKCPHLEKDCHILGCYATRSGNSLPTFRDNLSVQSSVGQESIVPYSSVKNPDSGFLIPKMWPIRCSETSVRNYHKHAV